MKLAELIAFLSDEDSCTVLYQGHKVKYLNEAGTPDDKSAWFVAGHEFGATHLIHVSAYHDDGYGTAWEAWIEACPTISEDELVEAYKIGDESVEDIARKEMPPEFESSSDWEARRAWIVKRGKEILAAANEAARDGHGEYPELVEGYEYQSNCTSTGIVDVGHYTWMNEAHPDDIEIVISADDAVDAASKLSRDALLAAANEGQALDSCDDD